MKKLKTPLSTNKFLSVILILAIVAVIGIGTVFAADTVKKSNMIGEDAAAEFAYLDAGINSSDVIDTEIELEKEGFGYVYEVKFLTGTAKYTYEINSEDGTVVEKEMKLLELQSDEESKRSETEEPEKNAEAEENTGSVISVDEAKKIALEHYGLKASEVTFSKAKLGKEDGKKVYEIEFFTDDNEYELEINAKSGKILSAEAEIPEEDDINAEPTSDSKNNASSGSGDKSGKDSSSKDDSSKDKSSCSDGSCSSGNCSSGSCSSGSCDDCYDDWDDDWYDDYDDDYDDWDDDWYDDYDDWDDDYDDWDDDWDW